MNKPVEMVVDYATGLVYEWFIKGEFEVWNPEQAKELLTDRRGDGEPLLLMYADFDRISVYEQNRHVGFSPELNMAWLLYLYRRSFLNTAGPHALDWQMYVEDSMRDERPFSESGFSNLFKLRVRFILRDKLDWSRVVALFYGVCMKRDRGEE